MTDTSYDVRVWSIETIERKRGSSYRVRWTVDHRKVGRTFTTRKLAESFHASILIASRRGEPFEVSSGLPTTMAPQSSGPTWFEFAQAFVDMKWPDASPRHRKSTAEALVTITTALTTTEEAPPNAKALRAALMRWAFNTANRRDQPSPPAEHVDALQWIARRSRPVRDLGDPSVLRGVLDALARNLDGSRASAATSNRKRATLTSAIGYAVERGHLDASPMPRVRVKRKRTTETVDSRVVVNHEQARALLAEVRVSAPALEAFYACIYYAAMRPSEVRNLRRADLTLPLSGWGEAVLGGSYQDAGSDWTDDRATGEERELKHRTAAETRSVPLTPQLVVCLRAHLDAFGTGDDGRLFVTRVGPFGRPVAGGYGRPVSVSTAARIWHGCRAAAFAADRTLFPGDPARSPLARRPYDLRHACVSTWLAAGVPAPQVAAWAGHSVAVLLKVYAKAVDGQETTARERIERALASGAEDTG